MSRSCFSYFSPLMGACGSSKRDNAVDAAKPSHEKRASMNSGGQGVLGGYALRFPRVRKAYKHVKDVFDAHASEEDQEKTVSTAKLRELMDSLGATHLSDDEIVALFKDADLDKTGKINFKKFIVTVGLGYYLKDNVQGDHKDEFYEDTRQGFKVVQEVFQKIDVDGGGTVDAEEMKKALFQTTDAETTRDILNARWAEMDFDDDGDITFKEFLHGFVTWVYLDDDDDEKNQ